jgi:S-adenosylmethionine-dependent methyltransferase
MTEPERVHSVRKATERLKDPKAQFAAGAEAWVEYNQRPLGRIRREITWHNLAAHLPGVVAPERPPRVLDAGGGSGELAIRLVQRGFRVWLLDNAAAMLEQADRAAQDLPGEDRARLTLCLIKADDAPGSFPRDSFDVITCHTLVEYLPDPRATLRELVNLLHGGGLLSVSFVNRHATVLRRIWSQLDPTGALASLENGAFCATLFEVAGTAYTAEEVSGWLDDLGMTVTATYGVRVFADYVPRDRLDEPGFFQDLLRLELAVAARSPYNQLARYAHVLARKGGFAS